MNPPKKIYSIAWLLLALFPISLSVAETQDNVRGRSPDPSRRPKIGLVLEGGGALGFAHVGLLKVLEEQRIPVDVVAGTSIGSIVGAGFASGLALAEMESALTQTDWEELFNEEVERSDLDYRLKSGRSRELYGAAKVGFKDGKLIQPQGLIVGQKILSLFQRLFGDLPNPVAFDALQLPFRAVTADLETGEAYVPSSGDLATVVRASMSVPGAFAPVEIDGRVLVDGGIVDNLPVDVARSLGADILIVSSLEDELPKREDLKSLFAISGQMVGLLLKQNSDLSKAKLTERDVLVPSDVKGYLVTDFDKGGELMARGEAAARANLSRLQELSVSEEEYQKYHRRRLRQPPTPTRINFVRLKNNSSVPDERILQQMKVKSGDEFDSKVIDADVQRIYEMGYFTSTRYTYVKEQGQDGVEIETNGKEYLRQFVRVGFALEDNLEGDESFRLGLSYRDYGLTTPDAYWETQLEIGKFPRAMLEFYQPIVRDSPYFINPILTYGRSVVTVLDGGERIAEYDRVEGSGSIYLGRALGGDGEAAIGYVGGFGDLERGIGSTDLPDISYDIGEAVFRAELDTLDNPDFPTSGWLGKVRFASSLEDLGASSTFDDLTGGISLPITWGRTTLIARGEFATTFGDRPVERLYSLGGFLDVSGYLQGELAASDYAQGKAILFHRFSEVHNPLFKLGFFLGGTVEVTGLQNDIESINDRNGIVSGSVFVGADTPVLPTYLGFGMSDESENSLYIAIGRIGPQRR